MIYVLDSSLVRERSASFCHDDMGERTARPAFRAL
eukprot:COSAG04_NODE_29902_length_266_cov_0.598802_2_plen_34_part_01